MPKPIACQPVLGGVPAARALPLGWNMTAIDRILVAVDFDNESAAALVYGRKLALRLGAELTVLHADENGRRRADAVTPAEALEIFVRKTDPDVTDGQCRVVNGDAVTTILTESLAIGVGLLVLGSHGRGRMGRMALGSVVSEVLRTVRAPVLVITAASELFVNGLVCVGVDFSPSSEAALVAAAALAQGADATVAVVHVLPFGDHHSAGHEVLRQEAFDRLEALRRRLVPSAVPSQSFAEMVRMSDPAATIVAHATQLGAQLIVVGGHGRSGVVEHALGTVAERVLERSEVPVLVVKSA